MFNIKLYHGSANLLLRNCQWSVSCVWVRNIFDQVLVFRLTYNISVIFNCGKTNEICYFGWYLFFWGLFWNPKDNSMNSKKKWRDWCLTNLKFSYSPDGKTIFTQGRILSFDSSQFPIFSTLWRLWKTIKLRCWCNSHFIDTILITCF